MKTEQLVARFIEIGVAQNEALLRDEITGFNRLYDEKVAVLEELKARPGDMRHALVSLHDHANLQVRLNAAKATLAVAPTAARKTLEAIRESRLQPQAGDAGMSLWNLERGVFKPT
jgi:ParB-like chromosome segregation protein Spo0J